MKHLIFLSFLFVAAVQSEEYGFVTKYIDMPLDHFTFTTNATFKLRYLVNDSYFGIDQPILFYTGNEGDISMFAQNTGFMFELAEKMGALIVFAEHRFYGETLPFGNESYSSPKTLGYLSAQQALADYVYLIDNLQKQYVNELNSLRKLPVISFGGSYGGMLAAWLRIKYPYSVLGAIASSAPIWQFQGITPCQNFNKIVTDVIGALGSSTCVETIKKSWSIFRKIASTDVGKQHISTTFDLCTSLKSDDDLDSFLNWLSEMYTMLVEVNYPYPNSFLVPLPGHPVRQFCSRMDSEIYNNDDGLIKALATGVQLFTNYTGTTKCNDIGQTASPSLGELGWDFQACTDMIMPMCSTDEDLFENAVWNFTDYSDNCYKQFGVRPRNEEVPILEFGGTEIETASNIVFSNGLLDPWSSGGVIVNVSAQVLSILMPNGAHHSDLRSANELDAEDVKTARIFHEVNIQKWLDKFYFRNLPLDNYTARIKSKYI